MTVYPPTADLSGRTALVTGAGGGIGSACVRALLAAGAGVVAVDKDEELLSSVGELDGCTPLHVDLIDGDLASVVPRGVDILVNNAGFQHVAPVEDFPERMFGDMWRLMVEAPFILIKSVLPGMYDAGWGRIINVSSIHGHRASPFKSAYVSAKHGLEGLSKVVALEGGARGVTSNTISPSYVRTPLVDSQVAAQAAANGLEEAAVLEEVFLRQSAVKRLIEPDEVAAIAVFLCSPQASYINGASMNIDGGWTAR